MMLYISRFVVTSYNPSVFTRKIIKLRTGKRRHDVKHDLTHLQRLRFTKRISDRFFCFQRTCADKYIELNGNPVLLQPSDTFIDLFRSNAFEYRR